MSNVNEVRAALQTTDEKALQVLGVLAQAQQTVDEIQAQLHQAVEGSTQPSVTNAQGAYAQVGDYLAQLLGLVTNARADIDAYKATL